MFGGLALLIQGNMAVGALVAGDRIGQGRGGGRLFPAMVALRLGLDGGERRTDGVFPGFGDQASPPCAQRPQVRPELAGVVEPGRPSPAVSWTCSTT